MTKFTPGDSALVIFPTEEISMEIDKWRRVYDPNSKVIPPHMTMAFPPFISDKQWLQERENFTTVLRAFEPFKVTLQKLGYFKGDSFVLWLEPEDGDDFIRMHSALQKQFPKYVPLSEFEYVPHLTIGSFESKEAMHQAKKIISSEYKALKFMADNVVYTVLDNDGIWYIKDRLSLG
ncbi:MAG: 2'-5' RNA ligase family protein [bacterium]